MPDYAAPVALGIKVPDATTTIGNIANSFNSLQQAQAGQLALQKARETLQADIAQRKAESQRAQAEAAVSSGTVIPRIEQQKQAAQQSQIATQSAQYKFTTDQNKDVLQMIGGLASSPAIQGAVNAKTPEDMAKASSDAVDAVMDMKQRAIDSGLDRKKVEVQFAPLLAKAAHDPASLPGILKQVILAGQAPAQQSGTITPAVAGVNTGQRTDFVNTGANPFAPPAGTVPMASVASEIPVTQPTVDPATLRPGIYGPQPRPGEAGGPGASNRQGDRLRILLDERANAAKNGWGADDIAGLDREIARLQGGGAPPNKPIQTGPAPGQAENIAGTVASNNQDFEETRKQASTASQDIGVLQNIKKYVGNAKTGFAADRRALVTSIGDYLGIPSSELAKTNTDLLAKNANMLALVGGNTDAARALAEAANPNIHMNAEAIRKAADQIIAQKQLVLEKQRYMQQFKNSNDPQAYSAALARWNANADPRVLQLSGMTKDEKQAMRRSMSDKEYADFKKKAMALHDMGVGQ